VEEYFASLSKRQTMLLLTSLAFGGSEAVASFEHLNVEEEELLKHRAQGLLQVPRDKRIPVVIQEIKRIVMARRRQLANADPKRLAVLLSKERSALVEVVLRALPSELADACRAAMGPRPTTKLTRDVRPDVLSIIRWKLEEGLRQSAPQVGTFRFTDLTMMPQREVISICDRMGARVLATAIAGLADESRETFLGKLPPDQRLLATKAAEAGRQRRLTEADATTVLEIHGGIENPSMGMRSAGAQRVVRAALAQSVEFAQRLTERYGGGELGKLFQRWLREEKGKPVKGDGGRLDIVEQMERLAQRGVIDRPMRLPPPMRPSLPAAALQPVPVPRRPGSGSQPVPPVLAADDGQRHLSQVRRGPPAPVRAPAAAPARDPIAERNARRAGVSTARPIQALPVARAGGDASSSGVRRIMRDGKPLERPESAPPPRRRAMTSPAIQEVPRRRDKVGADTGARSPVLKGPSVRGPRGGSE
jgi:hypothetical protein